MLAAVCGARQFMLILMTFATSNVCHTKTIGDTNTKNYSCLKRIDKTFLIIFGVSTENSLDTINKIAKYFYISGGFILITLELFTACTSNLYRRFWSICLR